MTVPSGNARCMNGPMWPSFFSAYGQEVALRIPLKTAPRSKAPTFFTGVPLESIGTLARMKRLPSALMVRQALDVFGGGLIGLGFLSLEAVRPNQPEIPPSTSIPSMSISSPPPGSGSSDANRRVMGCEAAVGFASRAMNRRPLIAPEPEMFAIEHRAGEVVANLGKVLLRECGVNREDG